MIYPFARYWTASSLVIAAAAWHYCAAPGGAQPVQADSAVDSAAAFESNIPAGDRRDADTAFSRPLTDEELEQALAFAKENMPLFHGLWSRFPPERQRRLPPRMQMGFRLLFDAKKSGDDRLYEVIAEQMKLRDEFIGLRRQHRQSNFAEETKEALKVNVRQMIDLSIRQREMRIEKMERLIAAEKAKLEKDRKNPDELIESQFRRLEEETARFVGFARRFGLNSNTPTQPATLPTETK